MGYTRQTSLPPSEPVSLGQMQQFLRLSVDDDQLLILGFIQAAREIGEVITGRALAKRTFVQVLDSHPYYTDTIQSQLACPPSYYSLPRYSTTLWNYSQMIKLSYSPVISVESMIYIGTDGAAHTLNQDSDFVLDRTTEPARIFPPVGQYWPADMYVANAVQINYTAGYDANPAASDTHTVSANPPYQQPSNTILYGVPQTIVTAIMMLVRYWYDNPGAAGADLPPNIRSMFESQAVLDFAPTRG